MAQTVRRYGKTALTIGILGIVVVMLITIQNFLPSLTTRINPQSPSLPSGQNQTPTSPAITPPLPPERKTARSYTGTVIAHDTEAREIQLETVRGTKRVLYTEATEFAAVDAPSAQELAFLSPQEIKTKFAQAQSLPAPSNITTGSSIEAFAAEAIAGKTEFTAVKIILIH